MKDLGFAKKIMHMEIHRNREARKLWLSQKTTSGRCLKILAC